MPTDDERYIYVGNGNKATVKAIGFFQIIVGFWLYFGFKIDFCGTIIYTKFNLCYCLEKCGYYCSFKNGMASLYLNSSVIGTSSLTDKLYKLNIKASNGNEILHSSNYGIKRKLTNENSSMLWHTRLGHILNQRIQRLLSEGILDPLDLSEFQVCIVC